MATKKQRKSNKDFPDLSWLYESRSLYYNNEQYKEKEQEHSQSKKKYLLETRLQLLNASLNKAKFDSTEFNALLNECVDVYIELNEDTKNLLII